MTPGPSGLRSRRAFAAGATAFLAACSRSTEGGVKLTYATAEELLARVRASSAAGRVTALHFWATWCGPCIEEFPLLEREWRGWMRDEPRIDFLAVSVDEPDSKKMKEKGKAAAETERDRAVRRFVVEQGATFPIAVAIAESPDAFASKIDPGWPSMLPATILFGLDGTVAMRELGELRVSLFREKVQELLAPSSGSR